MKKNIIILIILSLSITLFCQDGSESSFITLSEFTNLDAAIEIINPHIKMADNVELLNFSNYHGNINLKIENTHWRIALKNILLQNHLTTNEKGKYLIINNIPVKVEKVQEEDFEMTPLINTEYTDEVQIDLTFFIANSEALDEIGIDWTSLFKGEVDINTGFNGNEVSEDIFGIASGNSFDVGSGKLDLSFIFDTFSSNGLGSIISQPKITVISGEEGMVQDGEDFAIKSVDESGNTVEKFFKTGTIVTVKPEVKIDSTGQKFIEVPISAERSSVSPSTTTTIVKKSIVTTTKSLYDNEKAFVGGLTVQEERKTVKGIPILKDLPWWVFGIKYLTGYNKVSVTNKELLIFINAKILDNIKPRSRKKANYKVQADKFRQSLPAAKSEIKKKVEEKN